MRAATGFNTDDALRCQCFVAHQKVGVFAGVDIVGHDRQVIAFTQGQTQGQGQGGLAGSDRATDADAQRLAVH
ncbi:hypothetical protein ALP29_200970 [Pseudomonas syringae pv. avii]|uniref:Uncharacterized protein n=1 Tax=Pseudomonas syringae pv. avii TaxID=663959 RepID=A0A3M5TYA4_PSESX|nr:hypothetical protein ALP29_200970 [Pseudomonas syringae pv. avii]